MPGPAWAHPLLAVQQPWPLPRPPRPPSSHLLPLPSPPLPARSAWSGARCATPASSTARSAFSTTAWSRAPASSATPRTQSTRSARSATATTSAAPSAGPPTSSGQTPRRAAACATACQTPSGEALEARWLRGPGLGAAGRHALSQLLRCLASPGPLSGQPQPRHAAGSQTDTPYRGVPLSNHPI